MRHPSHLIAPLIAIAILSGCGGGAMVGPKPGAPGPAEKPVAMSITRAALLLQSADVRFRANGFWIFNRDTNPPPGTETPRVLANQLEVTLSGGTSVCRYADNADPEIKDTLTEAATLRLHCTGAPIRIFHSQTEKLEFYKQAWQTMLSLDAAEPVADRTRFESALAAFRSASVGPDIDESVRRHKVLAENAVREKRLWEAADAFEQGLALAPWWPQGNYNMALVFAELRADALAARYMARYLQLVPDAANARAAQDKIYLWQAEAKRVGQRP